MKEKKIEILPASGLVTTMMLEKEELRAMRVKETNRGANKPPAKAVGGDDGKRTP